MMMNKKKFRDEDDCCDQFNIKSKSKVDSLLGINKKFIYNENTEEEIQKISTELNVEQTIINYIHDFRFLDVSISHRKSHLIILHENPNPKLLALFKQVNCELIDLGLKDNEITLTRFIECLTNTKNSVDNIIHNLLNLPNENSTEKRKLFVYLNLEDNSLLFITVLNFLKSIIHNKQNKHEIIFITDDSIIFALGRGMNTIFLSDNLFTRKGIGLLPLEKSLISSKGLKWDITDWETDFGHMNLSTSNEVVEHECSIYVDSGSLAYTAEINIENIKF